jgi:EmrB/QacA subfamily drug resistance transporter
LHGTESDLQWFTSGYLLVLAAAMLPAALFGDRYGRRNVLVGALGLFAVGSVACAFAPTALAFTAARMVVGVAGAAVIVLSLATISVLFREDERSKAVGVWSAANFLSAPIGPILGGWLLSHYWWGWIFLMNLPVAVLGLVVAAWLVPEYRAARPPAIDWVGVCVSTLGLVAVTYGLIRAGVDGWASAGAVLPIGGGVVALVLFVRVERRRSEPLVDIGLFRSRSYTWGVALVALAILAMLGALFLMPQYFQGVLGTDAMGSGLRLLPLIGGLVFGALPASVVARVVGAKLTVAAGFALIAAGLFVGATTAVSSSTSFVASWMTLVGFGMGLSVATSSAAALAVLSQERSGVGSAVLQAVNKLGGPFGAAVVGSVLLSAERSRMRVTHDTRDAFTYGLDRALLVSACVGLVGVALALVFLPHRSDGSPPRKEPDIAASATAD